MSILEIIVVGRIVGDALALAVLLAGAAIFLWYYRYRFISFIRHEHTPDMDSRSPEDYTDKPFYYRGEAIVFFLRSQYGVDPEQCGPRRGPHFYRNH